MVSEVMQGNQHPTLITDTHISFVNLSVQLWRGTNYYVVSLQMLLLCRPHDAVLQPDPGTYKYENIACDALKSTILSCFNKTCSVHAEDPPMILQEHLNAKKAARDALERDYQASVDAKKAFEAAQEREKEAREAIKAAKAAVRQAAKIVVDPPATVRGPYSPVFSRFVEVQRCQAL